MHPSFHPSVPQSLRPLPLSLALAFACTAPVAYASTFEGSIVVQGNTVLTDGPAAAVRGFVYTTSDAPSTFDGEVSSGFSRVSAAAGRLPGASSASSTLVYRQTVTNNFGSAQNVSFGFVIPLTRHGVNLGLDNNLQTFSALASFMGDISWGGTSVWSVGYGLQASGSVAAGGSTTSLIGPTLSASASGFVVEGLSNNFYIETQNDLSGLAGFGSLSSAAYIGQLNLGVLEAGQSLDLVYTLSASAMFQGTYRDSSQAGAYGYGELVQAGGFDPFGIDFTPGPGGILFEFSPAPIPEPGTYALLLSGLGVLAWATRRRTSKQQ